MLLRLYNTLTKTTEPFAPIDGRTARMYSCGPTVYNFAHIGNLRAFIFTDVLQRTLRTVGGYDVRWVMNITDVDDKTIAGSASGSEAWLPEMGEQTGNPNDNLRLFTDYYSRAFLNDLSAVGIRLTDFVALPRATDYIAEMQDLTRRIIAAGCGYVSDGSVYFTLNEWRARAEYGRLFAIDVGNFQQGVRIDADEYDRESVSDFVLWKARKDGEPYWDFDLNGEQLPGRPGWHIECSAMGQKLLGLPFDIHTGGVDLRFPHHEDEIAQSMAGYGCETANFWCHNEFLEVEGLKMSKRYGNFFTLRDLTDRGIDPLDVRFAMMSAQYDSVLNFTFFGVESAAKARRRVQEFIYDLHDAPPAGETRSADAAAVQEQIFDALADNLHTPKALERLFAFMNETRAATLDADSRSKLLAVFSKLNDIFAVWTIAPRPARVIPDAVRALAERRWQAKKARNFAEADALRAEIAAAGYVMNDGRDSYSIEEA